MLMVCVQFGYLTCQVPVCMDVASLDTRLKKEEREEEEEGDEQVEKRYKVVVF